MQITDWKKALLRIPIAVLILLPFAAIFLIVGNKANLVLMIIFSTNIPSIGMFACLFAFADTLFIKLKLVNDDTSSKIPIERAKYV